VWYTPTGVLGVQTRGSTQQGMRCRRLHRARSLVFLPKVSLQGLELLVTVLLARNRQPPPTAAAGVPHAELTAELISLPSGLLAMVCEAIVKLKVRVVAAGRACVC
jgi:hypothetical protein